MKVVASDHHRLHTVDGPSPRYPWTYEEAPQRADAILAALVEAGLASVVAPEDHGLAPILAVHTADFVEYLRTGSAVASDARLLYAETYAGRGWRRRPAGLPGLAGYYVFDYSAPLLPGTWTAAYWSAQIALTAADLVRRGERAVYALCRPPGHHAAADLHGGFCYLNNAAIAARSLQATSQARVAIVDVDYHHGNGTQEIFYADPTVLVCSLHADPDADYPFFWGGRDERGEGSGEGFNRNWPLPLGTGDAAYLAALDEALEVVRAFAPQFLVVSLGFDLMERDPIALRGGFGITSGGLQQIAQRLAGLALPTLVVQEGGYAVDRLGEYVASFLRAFA